jgi:hypothetical protein
VARQDFTAETSNDAAEEADREQVREAARLLARLAVRCALAEGTAPDGASRPTMDARQPHQDHLAVVIDGRAGTEV